MESKTQKLLDNLKQITKPKKREPKVDVISNRYGEDSKGRPIYIDRIYGGIYGQVNLINKNCTQYKGNLSKKQPALVTSYPRKNDLLRISEKELVDSIDYVKECAGVVLDLASLRGLNDAEIEGIIVSISSRMDDSTIFLLEDSYERVDNLFRLIVSFDLDGAMIDSTGLGGSRLPAILPIIGLKAKSMGMYELDKSIMLSIDKIVSAEDVLISAASGFTSISAPSPEKEIDNFLKTIYEEIRGWMRELGIDDIDKIGRSNLRADNYDTAAISGLRLIGYERPLPMWLELR